MIESLEHRQLFSVALTAAAPAAEPSTPAPVEADASAAARKSGGDREIYLVVKLNEVIVAN